MAKTWFITGTSKGFGRIWAEAALARGDSVVATARDESSLSELKDAYGDKVLTMSLDVNDRQADFNALQRAHDAFGSIDIVVNNAGYGQFGAIEELSEHEARDQIETNLFGALWVTQAALPVMRQQGHGHILQVSSIGGVNAFPYIGMYNASKWGLEGFSQALAHEVADMGIHVTLIEPIGFSTDWAGPSAKFATENPAYDRLREANKKRSESNKRGDPQATCEVILELVDMDEPPLRLMLGKGAVETMHGEYQKRLDEWDTYKHLSEQSHGE